MNRRRSQFGAFFWLTLTLSLVGFSAAAYRGSPAVCLRRTLSDLSAGRVEALHYDLLGLADKTKLEPYALLVRGKLLLAHGYPDEAAEALSLAATHPVTRDQAAVLYGEALYSTGRFLEAGRTWASVLASGAENTDALRWLGIAYYDLGSHREATHYLERAAALAPEDPRPHHLIGIAWQGVNEWLRAANAFEESLRRDPRRPEAEDVRIRLAQCDSRLSKNREALSLLGECRESPPALIARARCEHNLGLIDDAIHSAREALRLDPENAAALNHLGEMEIQVGNLAAAADSLESLLRLKPGLTEAHRKLASVYWKLGRRADADREKQAVEDLMPLVQKYADLSEAATSDPTDARTRFELGNLAKRLHRIDEAKQWLRAAIYLDPENQAAQEALMPLLSSAASTATFP